MHLFKNRFVIGCVCIILAFAIGFIGVPLLSSAASRKITVVAAKIDITKGTELDASMFYEHKISAGDIPYNSGEYYTVVTSNGSQSELPLFSQNGGKLYAEFDILQNDIVTKQKVTSEYPYSDMEIRTLGDDHYAVAVNVSSLAAGVAGKVRAGDVLTLMIYSDNDSVFIDSYLNYVKVISVSDSNAADIIDNPESSGSSIPSVITFDVDVRQAMLLAEYNSNYRIHYALAARANTEKSETLMNEQEKLLGNEHKLGRLEDQ